MGSKLATQTLEDLIEATLEMSNLGLVDLFEQAQLAGQANLLLIVDQFEELFRYRPQRSFIRGSEPDRRARSCLRQSLAWKPPNRNTQFTWY